MNALKRWAAKLRARPDWQDGRGCRVILVPHCILNQNARSAGAAERPAAVAELVTGLLDRDIGILQMPCPELYAFGLDRSTICIEKELRTPLGRGLSRSVAKNLAEQIRTYQECGIRVLGILGKNGSPSCGVEETWVRGVCAGSGAFIEELAAELKEQNIRIAMTGIRDSEPDKALATVDRWLESRTRS